MSLRVSAKIPATSANLGPGFDCMGLAVDLFNHFSITTDAKFHIGVTGVAAGQVSTEHDNLLVQAAALLLRQQDSDIDINRWNITIDTRIPSASGLGSSASAIAAGMLLANEILGLQEPSKKLSRMEVVHLATEMEGHPDNVTPALLGGAWLALYRGHRLQTFSMSLPPDLTFVVATPAVQVPTDESRKSLSDLVPRADAVYSVAQGARLALALERGNLKLLEDDFGDLLHEPARLGAVPYYNDVVASARRAGAACATLSGSGPTLLLWCEHPEAARQVRTAVMQVWRDRQVDCAVTVRFPWRAITEVKVEEATL